MLLRDVKETRIGVKVVVGFLIFILQLSTGAGKLCTSPSPSGRVVGTYSNRSGFDISTWSRKSPGIVASLEPTCVVRFCFMMNNRGSFLGKTQRRRSRGISRVVWTGSICGVLLLIAVAFLQYRWNMQIRQATEVRLGADLESVMLKWHLNLYREFSTICIALQVGPDSGAEDHWSDYLHRYEDWRRAASDAGSIENLYSNPDVVSNIYIYETSRGASEGLLVLNADADRIEQSTTPAGLDALLVRLQRRSASLRVALRAWESEESLQTHKPEGESSASPSLRSKAITGWQFDESIPAIVHPILHRTAHVVRADTPVDWLVVVLNQNTIAHRIFPELAHRYFEDTHGLEYRIAVASTGKSLYLLYSSDSDFGIKDMSGADSVMNIFGPPPESTEGSFWQVVNDRESLHGEEWRRFSGPVWFPVFQQSDDNRKWMLFLKRRGGPIEASITRAWQANLLTGVVALLLLATSMLLVLIATRHERTLAAMQLDFVTSVSHELRTPLAAVLAAGQNLSDGYALDVPRYGSLITAEARQLIDLVDQILLFAALKNGKKKYQLTPVTINDVFDSLGKTTFTVLRTSGFNIDLKIEDSLPRVLGNKQGLVRCLQNLIDNAAKYSGQSRWIGISAGLEELGNLAAGIKITVADHGVGIAPSELHRVFESFYRGPGAIAAQIHGSGLGLSLVKHVVEEMQGTVSVTSNIGEGSIFVLHLRTAENSLLRSTTERQEASTLQ
jgi:signal transduction histidine kinase